MSLIAAIFSIEPGGERVRHAGAYGIPPLTRYRIQLRYQPAPGFPCDCLLCSHCQSPAVGVDRLIFCKIRDTTHP